MTGISDMIEYPDGTKEWYLDYELHRLDGPAIEFADGSKYWYRNGLKHRLDGPAIEDSSGANFWFINDEHVSGKVIAWLEEQNITLPMSESELSMFILKFVGK